MNGYYEGSAENEAALDVIEQTILRCIEEEKAKRQSKGKELPIEAGAAAAAAAVAQKPTHVKTGEEERKKGEEKQAVDEAQ